MNKQLIGQKWYANYQNKKREMMNSASPPSMTPSEEIFDATPATIAVIDHAIRDATILALIDSKFKDLKSENVSTATVKDLLLDIRLLVSSS